PDVSDEGLYLVQAGRVMVNMNLRDKMAAPASRPDCRDRGQDAGRTPAPRPARFIPEIRGSRTFPACGRWGLPSDSRPGRPDGQCRGDTGSTSSAFRPQVSPGSALSVESAFPSSKLSSSCRFSPRT